MYVHDIERERVYVAYALQKPKLYNKMCQVLILSHRNMIIIIII